MYLLLRLKQPLQLSDMFLFLLANTAETFGVQWLRGNIYNRFYQLLRCVTALDTIDYG